MRQENYILLSCFTFALLLGLAGGMNIEKKKSDKQDELIEQQSESIELLKERLKTSNEKRGRLFLAWTYKDMKGKEAALDSLIVEIGKDN